jgi:hypothetical protein
MKPRRAACPSGKRARGFCLPSGRRVRGFWLGWRTVNATDGRPVALSAWLLRCLVRSAWVVPCLEPPEILAGTEVSGDGQGGRWAKPPVDCWPGTFLPRGGERTARAVPVCDADPLLRRHLVTTVRRRRGRLPGCDGAVPSPDESLRSAFARRGRLTVRVLPP